MVIKTLFRALVWVLAAVFGWVPFIGKFLITQHKRNQFEQTFGVPYWHNDAEEVSHKQLAVLESEWKMTGCNPKANKKYARSQEVAGFLHELRA